jgi:hypothetical protein
MGVVLGNEHVTGLDIEDCVCGGYTCAEQAVLCAEECGGTDNVELFTCIDGVLQDPCLCGNEPITTYTPGTFDGAAGGETTPTELNTGATADNTAAIAEILNQGMADQNVSNENIENLLTDIDEQLQPPDMNNLSDLAGAVGDHISDDQDSAINQAISDISDELLENQISPTIFDDIVSDMTGIIPSPGSCSPFVIATGIGIDGLSSLTLTCETSEKIKFMLSWLFASSTLVCVYFMIYAEMRPRPETY